MLKKGYIIIALAVVSVLLGSLFYNNVTLAQQGKKPTEVDVINLPIDEQGNLRTTIVQATKIMVVFNETLTVPSNLWNFIYLTSFNASGFKYANIMAKASGTFADGTVIMLYAYDNNFGVRTLFREFPLDTTSRPEFPSWGAGSSGRQPLYSQSVDLYLRVYNGGFNGLLTVVVFLSS